MEYPTHDLTEEDKERWRAEIDKRFEETREQVTKGEISFELANARMLGFVCGKLQWIIGGFECSLLEGYNVLIK